MSLVKGTCMACRKSGSIRMCLVTKKLFRCCKKNEVACKLVVNPMAITYRNSVRGRGRPKALILDKVNKQKKSRRDKQNLLKELLARKYRASVASAPKDSLGHPSSTRNSAAKELLSKRKRVQKKGLSQSPKSYLYLCTKLAPQ